MVRTSGCRSELLMAFYRQMLAALGPSNWWPGETAFEICLGAILTQNTNWQNVEKAISNLKQRDLLTPQALYALGERELAELIRPAGYFRVKARRIRHFLDFLHQGTAQDQGLPGPGLGSLQSLDMATLRRALLQVKGIGPETADSMLLYAFDRPSFVVDAYTARIFHRHGLVPENVGYDELKAFFMDVLDPDVALFNEFHALIVRVGKDWCKKKKPLCPGCPLQELL